MKESYEEGLAIHLGPEPYACGGDATGVAWVSGTRRPAIELRNQPFRVPTLSNRREGNTRCAVNWQGVQRRAATGKAHRDAAESKTLCMCGNSRRENREILLVSVPVGRNVTAERNGLRTPVVVLLT